MGNVKFNVGQILIFVYVVLSIIFSSVEKATLFYNWIKPIYLIVTALVLLVVTENHHGRFPRLKENIKTIIILTLFYIIIYYLSGLVLGFAPTMYSLKAFPINLFRLIVPIIMIEYIRSALVNDNRQSKLMIVLYTIFFIVTEINFNGLFNSLTDIEPAFKYISAFIAPLVFSNICFTYMTLKGSYKLILPFRVTVETVMLLTPILPAHDWFVTGMFGILTPVIMFVIFRYDLNKRDEERRVSRRKREKNPIVYFPLFGVLIVFILFMAGVFKYEPIAIVSNSMVPVFHRGDVVIYSKPTEEELKNIEIDNIIVYSKDKQRIVHRIKEIYEEDGHTFFITKGDANVTDDASPVKDEQLVGIYKTHIKFLGYPSVWLNQIFKHEKPTVEIK